MRFVRVLSLGVEKAEDVGMVCVEVNRASALPCAKLIGIREAVFEKLHHWDHARRLVLDTFDRCAMFAQVRKHERHPAATLREL